MRKAFKYRAYANRETIAKAERWLELCRRLYNCALEERIIAYKSRHKSLSAFTQMKELPALKCQFPEYKEVGAQVLQEVLERLDYAYQTFFRRFKNGEKAGYPRFKSQNRYNSFTLKQSCWKLESKYLVIYNLGRFKLRLSRSIKGIVKTVTIRRSSTNKWYAIFSCDKVLEKKLPESDKAVGIDVGVSSFCVDSDGNKTENPRYLKKSLKLLRRRQRKYERKAKGSNGRGKAKLLVAKAYEKVRCQRADFLHKSANHYVRNYGKVIFESLSIEDMMNNRRLTRSISDAGWGQFIELVAYKAEEAGRTLIRIPRFEPTSKTCSACGAVNKDLTLNDRQWVCKSCGTLHDRDFNAAKNILRVGQLLWAQTKDTSLSVAQESLVGECQPIWMDVLDRGGIKGHEV